ncbi:YigZ family protein [Haloimpatiens sp. FM7315]|uniref:YigZ family protein n=1 Tax=Haloimpatiens sp. FM7315 TaxID=3298609 RepID=UPI0035A336BF
MSYLTVNKKAEAKFIEKKSEFIGYVKRTETEEEAKAFIDYIKKMNSQATHNVYAYVIGKNMGIQRYSDDGEPQGSAGIPVLEVIKKQGISDCTVVVTRYFGGILLGASGLVRAYSKGAASAISEAGVVEKVKGLPVEITIEYDMLGKFQYFCEQNLFNIEKIQYTDKVKITFYFEVDKKVDFEQKIIDVTKGKGIIEERDEDIFFKRENRLFLIS